MCIINAIYLQESAEGGYNDGDVYYKCYIYIYRNQLKAAIMMEMEMVMSIINAIYLQEPAEGGYNDGDGE